MQDVEALHRQDATEPGSSRKRRYAVCGLSHRAVGMYVLPLIDGRSSGRGEYFDHGELVAILDIDQERTQAFKERAGVELAAYDPDHFDEMITDTQPDVVIVAGPDWTHAEHIVKALQHDVDVVTEKPMVIDCQQARAVIEAEAKSRASVRVTFNSRYRMPHQAMKRMIKDGLLGRITNVEFVHNLDTYHGTSYFYRWNRYRERSGGLTITKAVHHFDLINWLLDDVPQQVFSYGALNYYGPDSPYNPSKRDGRQYSVQEQQERCPYHQRWSLDGNQPKDDHLVARAQLPYKVQYPDDEPMYIYDEDIDIEDTYSAVMQYRSGASMSYSANFSAPWEGYILGINGTEGRLETVHYTSPARCPFPASARQPITYYPLFGERQIHETRQVEGGHDGSDRLLKRDLFTGSTQRRTDELGLEAGSEAGAYAVAVGEATWRSVRTGHPVDIAALLGPDAS